VSICRGSRDPAHLVAAINDYNTTQGMSAFTSSNGGRTWVAATLDHVPLPLIGDPELAFVALAHLSGRDRLRERCRGSPHRFSIASFTPPMGAGLALAGLCLGGSAADRTDGFDFPALAVARGWATPSPHLSGLDNLQGAASILAVTVSHDGGYISSNCAGASGDGRWGSATVDRDGTLYVVYEDYTHTRIDSSP